MSMEEMFYYARGRMSDLIGRVKDDDLSARLIEHLQAMSEAFYGLNKKYEYLQREHDRLQNRYNKLKSERQ